MSQLREMEQSILSKLLRKREIGSGIQKRISILTHYYEKGENKKKVAELHQVGRAVVYQWLARWNGLSEQRQIWAAAYKSSQISFGEYEQYIISIFRDAPRNGTAKKFDEQTIEKIVSLATANPQSLGLPFSRWSEALLQKELIKRKIVKSISCTQIGRFLKKASNPTSS